MKNLTVKLLILFLATGSLAQAQGESPFRFGIHGTPAIAYIATDDPNYDGSAELKFNFGLMAEYYFADHYAFATGVTVAQSGGELMVRDSRGGVNSMNLNASYIQLPVKLKMTTREFGYFTGFAEFGGGLAVNIDEKVSFSPNLPAEASSNDDYINLFNAMFTIGLGAEYNLGGTTSLMAGLYYNRSLIDNFDDENDKTYAFTNGEYEYRFDYVSLRLGILF